jgi:signal-transduction protein with cAMP-binding, CBS, and nucleotidyltransferase domain
MREALKSNIFRMRRRNIFLLSIFRDLTQEQQDLLLPLVSMGQFSAGDTIFKQGEPATRLYVLESGLVDIVYRPEDGPELLVASLNSGGVFGWSSTLGHDTYTSAAYAVMDCEVYSFIGCELKHLCVNCPETGVVILDRLALAIAKRVVVTHASVMNVLSKGMDLKYEL